MIHYNRQAPWHSQATPLLFTPRPSWKPCSTSLISSTLAHTYINFRQDFPDKTDQTGLLRSIHFVLPLPLVTCAIVKDTHAFWKGAFTSQREPSHPEALMPWKKDMWALNLAIFWNSKQRSVHRSLQHFRTYNGFIAFWSGCYRYGPLSAPPTTFLHH